MKGFLGTGATFGSGSQPRRAIHHGNSLDRGGMSRETKTLQSSRNLPNHGASFELANDRACDVAVVPGTSEARLISLTPTNNFGTQRRNQFRGPGYFDTDFDVEKSFGIPKWESATFSVGARFFNLFHHPNFAFPNTNADSGQFGQITQTVSQPTTICGSGLGAEASPRVIELQAKFVFSSDTQSMEAA
jgi:hypothetical protein